MTRTLDRAHRAAAARAATLAIEQEGQVGVVRRALMIMGIAVVAGAALTACSPATAETPGVVGSWGSDEAGQPSLTIDEDGAFSGGDGCNALAGTGTLAEDASSIDLGVVAGTMMACVGVDEWLGSGATAEVAADGTELIVRDADGAEIGRLAAA
ncbi:META domain-containing protein [Brachybacterium sp. DNPG3]